jgi:protein phosphatase PTC7
MQLFGSTHYEESPLDADVYSHPLMHGDVVLLATDGVWDNLSPQDVLDVVCGVMVRFKGWVLGEGGGVRVGDELADIAENCVPNGQHGAHADSTGKSAENLALSSILATAIVKEAKEASVNKNRESPFGKALKIAYPYETWRGGKVDDICVVASLVIQDGRAAS